MHGTGGKPAGQAERDGQDDHDGDCGAGDARREGARRERLVGAPDGAVALAVEEVVAPADRQLTGQHGRDHQHGPLRREVDRDGQQAGQHRDRERRHRVGGAEQQHGDRVAPVAAGGRRHDGFVHCVTVPSAA